MAKGDFTFEMDEKTYVKVMGVLNMLSEVDRNAEISSALKSGLKIIKNQGKANLTTRNKEKTGNLKKAFSVSVRKKVVGYTGFKRSNKRKGIKGGNHAHLVDRGTKDRYTKKGYYRGSVSRKMPNTGSLFWTDAAATKGREAMLKLLSSLNKTVKKIIN